MIDRPASRLDYFLHKLADMVIAIELARSILLYAAAGLDDADPTRRASAVSECAVRLIESIDLVGQHAIQLHGGMGVTRDHLVSHYFLKLTVLKRRLGPTAFNLARVQRRAAFVGR